MRDQDKELLKKWFLSNSRALPWRARSDPYAIWISEVMLQQTQAAVVIPYFERWMQHFPTISHLAQASLQEVLKLWEGLGYYSRARHLHEGAQMIVDAFAGQLPSTSADLRKIKGLGPYTIGAILSFAFHQRKAAVDGNVLRVLTRYYGLSDDISKAKTVKKIEQMADELLPEKEPWIVSEALIELGATVCLKKTKCEECPLMSGCEAFKEGLTTRLPVKAAKKPVTLLFRAVAVIMHEDWLLIGRGRKGAVMADLCEFPYFALDQLFCDAVMIQQLVKTFLNLEALWQMPLTVLSHSFTRYRACLIPHLLHAKKRQEHEGFEWIKIGALKNQPFSSGHRRILSEFLEVQGIC